jgi:hypothetical protein
MAIIGPDFGMFSLPRHSGLEMLRRVGITIAAPTFQVGLLPRGLPCGGRYFGSVSLPRLATVGVYSLFSEEK